MLRVQTVTIASRNDDFQVLVSLKTNRQKRTKRRQVFVEGVAIINQLVRAGLRVEAVAYAADTAGGRRDGTRPRTGSLSDWAKHVIAATSPSVCYELAAELMRDLSDRENPSELIVVARRPDNRLPDDEASPGDLVVVLDRPASPGNLGSAIRSCDAFGVDLVIVTGHASDIWDPQCLRASLGAVFSVPTVHEPSSRRLIGWLDSQRLARPGFRVLGTDSGGELAIDSASVTVPLAVVFGNEATGLSQTLREYVDAVVSIPMRGSVNSLNLAAALSITVYEIDRRRRDVSAAGRVPIQR